MIGGQNKSLAKVIEGFVVNNIEQLVTLKDTGTILCPCLSHCLSACLYSCMCLNEDLYSCAYVVCLSPLVRCRA